MPPDNQPIYDTIRDIHSEQLKATATLARIEQAQLDTKDDIKEIKEKVDRHERAYVIAKYYGIPSFAMMHLGVKSILNKLGF